MMKEFNVEGLCIPEKHYMVDLTSRLEDIKHMVEEGKYFTINKARQYGKTTTLYSLYHYLKDEYSVIKVDFQVLGAAKFINENIFSLSFAKLFLKDLKKEVTLNDDLLSDISSLENILDGGKKSFELLELFEFLRDICCHNEKSIVLMIDEIDSASNNQVFLDFLSQLRYSYLNKDMGEPSSFQSVILAGVYDIKNIRSKIRGEDEHKTNSPWNIAADFLVDMSFDQKEIAVMLREYERDKQIGLDVDLISGLLYEYTSGYPFFVSLLCKIMAERLTKDKGIDLKESWSRQGFLMAMRLVLSESNTLFESLLHKLNIYKELDQVLYRMLLEGGKFSFNPYVASIDIAVMLGFVKNADGELQISNKIFEIWLYNYYLAREELKNSLLPKEAVEDKNIFVHDGRLDMKLVLEKFVQHFNDIYADHDEAFLEEQARKYFLLYLRPIINGTGNYYIESRTRGLRRTDIIVDYGGEQFVIEMKIWHGNAYNERGEEQLIRYLDDYNVDTGYLISFSFNKSKESGVYVVEIGDKKLIEAIV